MVREISHIRVLAIVVLAAISGFRGTEAVSYAVGGSSGWQTPSTTTFYSDWASNITFSVGDTLVFTFITGVHDVAIVTSKDLYDNCNTGSGNSILTTGPATVTLNTTGTHYFLCTFAGHCSRGQKLSVTVGSTSTPSTPSPPGSPPTTGTTSPPPPPPSGSAIGLGADLATMFTSIVMGYLILFY